MLESLGLMDATGSTALAVGGAIAAVAVVAVVLSQDKPDPAGARRIHRLDSTLPLLGNLLAAIANEETFHDWSASQCAAFNGEPWRFIVPGQPHQIIVSSPDAVEELTTKQFRKFPKGPSQIEIIETMFGRGLLATDGEHWHRQRKTAAKFFSAKVLRNALKHSVQKGVHRMEALLDKAAKSGDAVDLKKLFHDFTLDTFVEMALGVDLHSIGAREPSVFQAALDVAAPVTTWRARRPRWFWKLQQWLRVGSEGDMARSVDTIYAWLKGIIKESIDKCIARNATSDAVTSSDTKTIVELFIESGMDDEDGVRQEDLADFVLTLVIGARDTTADTLSWFFYILAQHPEVEKKLRQEMAVNLADVADDTFLTTDHTRNMVYLEACIKETLRLYPAVPYMFRQATEDTVLCGDIFVKKGENVGISTYGMGRLTRLWGEDALEFKPDRWIDEESGKIKQLPPTHFVAFSSGPRMCVGMNLAMMELRVGLANLLRRFTFDVDHATNAGAYVLSPTLAMKNPLMGRPSRSRPPVARAAD